VELFVILSGFFAGAIVIAGVAMGDRDARGQAT